MELLLSTFLMVLTSVTIIMIFTKFSHLGSANEIKEKVILKALSNVFIVIAIILDILIAKEKLITQDAFLVIFVSLLGALGVKIYMDVK